MIKSHELRIGSWVIVMPFEHKVGETKILHSNWQVCQITSIQKHGDSCVLQVNDNILAPIPIEQVLGVPLSEEILEKGGFLQSHNKFGNTFHIMEDNGFVVKYTIEHWTNTDSEQFKNRFHADKVGKVEFVHQVQNILLSLFGIDLDFSCLRCSEVQLCFEEGNPVPVNIKIELLNI